MTLREKIEQMIAGLEVTTDFNDEFYRTYTGELNDGDISDWYNNHFDDNVSLGVSCGETMATASIIGMLTAILETE